MTFTYEEADFLAAARTRAEYTRRRFVASLVGLGSFYLVVSLWFHSALFLLLSTAALLFIGWRIGEMVWWEPQRRFQRDPGWGRMCEVTISPAGMRWVTSIRDVLLPWPVFVRLCEGQSVYLLDFTDPAGLWNPPPPPPDGKPRHWSLIMPRRVFAAGEESRFRAIVQSEIPEWRVV